MTTVVVGGGLAGALVARALHLAGEDVAVVDAGEAPGGIARPIHRDGHLLEPAVGSFLLPHPHLGRLVEGLPVEIRAAEPSARRRFVHHRGRTIEIRPGPGLVAAPLISPLGKLRAVAEPLIRGRARADESLEAFLRRRLGREAGRLAAWLMAAGAHAGDPSALSTEATFPALTQLEREHGSLLRGALSRRRAARVPVTHVVVGGMAGIAEAVSRSLGGRWNNSWPVSRLEQTGRGWRVHGPDVMEAERVVAAVAPEILAELHPPIGLPDSSVEWAPVAVVWLGLEDGVLPQGFGVLIGPDAGFVTLGFMYESAYAPDRAPAGKELVKAVVGGAANPSVVGWHDDRLTERVMDELARVLGSTPEVGMRHVVRLYPGIPQYTAARRHVVAGLRRSLPPGLVVSGWAYDGVGVSHLATAAARLAGL